MHSCRRSHEGSSDPALVLIAEKQAAIEGQDEGEVGTGFYSDATSEARERCADAVGVVNEADWKLATTLPTTLAGVAAVLRFENQIEDEGGGWPDTATGAEGWYYQLRKTIAEAVETVLAANSGAVTSAIANGNGI